MLKLNTQPSSKIERLEILPFKIDYEGEANCDLYFYSKLESDTDHQQSTVSLYGHSLKGKDIPIPSSCNSLIVDLVENDDNTKLIDYIV